MTRPAVSVVMPFAGDATAAAAATEALLGLQVEAQDELILADNGGAAMAAIKGVRVVRADGERSAAHARNVGARVAGRDWILFLDADCRPPASLLESFFAVPLGDEVGAVAGEVVTAAGAGTAAARYAQTRNFLGQEAHLAHPYLPRAVAANLLVRRTTFEQLGGFLEGLRAAEDTDFCWRLQQAGWTLAARAGARVEHVPRARLSQLRAQWRGYAAGRAWLSRRYPDFTPQPAALRALRRLGRRTSRPPAASAGRTSGGGQRLGHLLLDVWLAVEELLGLALSNRPSPPPVPPAGSQPLVACVFPPPPSLPAPPQGSRVEALRRPPQWVSPSGRPQVVYAEDDGVAERLAALLGLLARRPGACVREFRSAGAPRLSALTAMARRIGPSQALQPLPEEQSRRLAARLGALGGVPVSR